MVGAATVVFSFIGGPIGLGSGGSDAPASDAGGPTVSEVSPPPDEQPDGAPDD